MTLDVLRVAERVSFEAFVNCYLSEIAGARWCTSAEHSQQVDRAWHGRGAFVLSLVLANQSIRVALDVTYRSAVGHHGIGLVRIDRGAGWQDGDRLQIAVAMVRELYASRARSGDEGRAQELELVLRMVESQQVMARYLEARAKDRSLDSDRFIESEQSMLYGHWCHPTPKSRQGMTEWQHETFAPELGGRFQLHCFAVSNELVTGRSVLEQSAAELISSMLARDPRAAAELVLAKRRGETLVPVHPLQVDWLMHQAHVQRWMSGGKARHLGPLGLVFTPTSSVRTVYSEDWEFMLKLSIPVRITNSVRFNRRHELFAGVAMSQLLRRLGRRATPIRMIADPAYMTVERTDGMESGFELTLRENPFRRGCDDGVHCVAALVQAPLPHRPSRLRGLIEGLALTEGRSVRAVSVDWLSQYLACALEPLIRLYDEQGIALEAHQQNSLLDVTAGYPRTYYFRDNQGYYLSAAHRARLTALEPELLQRPELFFDDGLIQRRFSYYVVGNHLFAVLNRLGADELLEESAALGVVKSRLEALARSLSGLGRSLVRGLVHHPHLPQKANLLTRVRDVDELSAGRDEPVYVEVPNPIHAAVSVAELELEVA